MSALPAEPIDHRVRVAEARRAAMRERLIDATMAAYAAGDPTGHPVVDDVIRHAGVSRGSFYKHFDAVDAVFAVIGQRMAQEMLVSYSQLVAPLQDSAARMEPRHGAFIARVDFFDFLSSDRPRTRLVAMSLQDGRQHGTLDFNSIDAAIDLVIGISLEGARRILRTGTLDGAYIRELTGMVLRGLGAPPADADLAVGLAWRRLVEASDTLHWWKPVSPA